MTIKILSETHEHEGRKSTYVLNINKFPYRNLAKIIKDQNFITEAERLNIEDPFVQTAQKIDIFKRYFRYTKLKVSGGSLKIEECLPERIGKAFKSNYNAAKNRLIKQEEIERLNYMLRN